MTWYRFLIGLCGGFCKIFFRAKIYNAPKALPDKALVLCSNHISLCDAVLLAYSVKRPIVFLAKKDLFKIPFVGFLIKKCGVIPLSRDGNDTAPVRKALFVLKEDGFISIFPQGTRYYTGVEKTQFKSGAGMLVSLSNADVICAGIYASGYKVRPLKKTVIVFGDVKKIEYPEKISSRDRNEFVTGEIFREISKLEKSAEERI